MTGTCSENFIYDYFNPDEQTSNPQLTWNEVVWNVCENICYCRVIISPVVARCKSLGSIWEWSGAEETRQNERIDNFQYKIFHATISTTIVWMSGPHSNRHNTLRATNTCYITVNRCVSLNGNHVTSFLDTSEFTMYMCRRWQVRLSLYLNGYEWMFRHGPLDMHSRKLKMRTGIHFLWFR